MEGEFVCLALPVPEHLCRRGVPARSWSTSGICHRHCLHTRVPSVPAWAQGGSARRPPAALGARLAAEHPSEGLGPWPSHRHGGASPGTAGGNRAARALAGQREPAQPRSGEHAAGSSCQNLAHATCCCQKWLPILPSPLRGQPPSWASWAGWHMPSHQQLAQSGNLCSESMSK